MCKQQVSGTNDHVLWLYIIRCALLSPHVTTARTRNVTTPTSSEIHRVCSVVVLDGHGILIAVFQDGSCGCGPPLTGSIPRLHMSAFPGRDSILVTPFVLWPTGQPKTRLHSLTVSALCSIQQDLHFGDTHA